MVHHKSHDPLVQGSLYHKIYVHKLNLEVVIPLDYATPIYMTKPRMPDIKITQHVCRRRNFINIKIQIEHAIMAYPFPTNTPFLVKVNKSAPMV